MGRCSSRAIAMILCLIAAFMTGCVKEESCKVVFFGTVRDASTEAGIEGARTSADGGITAQSGAGGAFETTQVTLKPGKVTLRFTAEGFAPVSKDVVVTRSARLCVNADMFPASAGRPLVEFKFTLSNDYEPEVTVMKASAIRSVPMQTEGVEEASGVVVYPAYGAKFGEIRDASSRLGSRIMESVPEMGYMLMSLPEGERASEFSERLKGYSWVEDAEPDYVCYPLGGYIPDDMYWPQQWALRASSMHRMWRYGIGTVPVVVAVVDTGVDVSHPDLSSRCLPMLNSINTDMRDNAGHGTHVTGIIAAEMDNSIGIAGVSPNAVILPIKSMEKRGSTSSGTMSTISRGIRLAADNGADIINMSIGWPLFFSDSSFRLLREALDYADSKGCVLVAAAGNNGSDTDLTMPGKYEKCFSVGAITPLMFTADYSNTGPGLDIFAPGGGMGANGVLSTVPFEVESTGYVRMSGTSMATPHISGMLAVLMSLGMDADEAKDALVSSSEYLEGEDVGIANCYAAASGARGSRALFWLCDEDSEPLSYAFRGSDASRDMVVFGDAEGSAFLCGWVGLSATDYPAQGDFFGKQEVFLDDGLMSLPSILKLKYVDLEDEESLSGLTVPEIWGDGRR